MDGIAQAAGVAKGTVYLYYKSKEDIFRQILDEDLAQFQDETVPPIGGPGDIEHKLGAFFLGVLGFFDRKKDFCEHAIFEMGAEVRKKALQRFEVVFKAQVDAWQTLLAEAQRDGVIDPIDARATAVLARRRGQRDGQAAAARLGGGPVEDVGGAGEPDVVERPGGAMTRHRFAIVARRGAALAAARPPLAQEGTPLTLRGVPQGTVSATPVALTLKDAVQRGLQQNLAAILEEQRLQGRREHAARGAQRAAAARRRIRRGRSEQKISTAAFGFEFPGLPRVIGPFGVFDARLTLSTPLVRRPRHRRRARRQGAGQGRTGRPARRARDDRPRRRHALPAGAGRRGAASNRRGPR